jgi:signal recognition particle receptor subunit beta
MPVVDHRLRDLHLKLVYYGPGLGGKTTNLEYLHAHTKPEYRGKLLSLTNETERTLFFDLLPVELGKFKDYTIRLHLCTVPGQIRFDETRRLVLRHADGIVFVADSQEAALDANVDSVRNLETNLVRQGDDPTRMPLVVQYNKRDLPDVMAPVELRAALAVPAGVPEILASARFGEGVAETLRSIVKACLTLAGDPKWLPQGRSPSILPGTRASMMPGGKPAGRSQSIPPTPPLPRIRYDDEG